MYPAATAPDGLLIIRIDAPIYYANVEVSLQQISVTPTAHTCAGCSATAENAFQVLVAASGRLA